MNIITVLNKLKSVNMVSNTEDSLTLFSDCFTKFGISLLLLNDENKFNHIVDALATHSIPLQKADGIYALRIFAVDANEVDAIIKAYEEINELDFLRQNPEYIAEAKTIYTILNQMKNCQMNHISYKDENGYRLDILNADTEVNVDDEDVLSYLQSLLQDKSLIEKLETGFVNTSDEETNADLELQKVENKICEEYLFPVEDGWQIIIDKKEVNPFQEIKNTIQAITKLNVPISFHDALLLVLFYKTNLSVQEVDMLVKNVLFKGEM